MQARILLAMVLSALTLSACGGSSSNSARAVEAPPARNDDGSPVTGVITARFNPSGGVVPFPTNLLLSGTNDLTLNIPTTATRFSDPTVALNTLDGFSTVAPWSTTFSVAPNPATIAAGQSVRMFEVTLTGPGGGVTGIVRELQAGTEFVTALAASDTSGRTLAIVPVKPLKQLTSYMAVITDDVREARGNDATPDQTYFLAKRGSPLCVGGQSTDPLIPTANACALEPLRLLVNSQETAAAGAGIPRSEIVLSWVATTQSITPVLQAVRSTVQPAPVTLANSGSTIAVASLPPIADIYIGTITLPYYLTAPSADNPTAPLTEFWHAAPGAYVPPFNQVGLSSTSTHITFANPLPVATGSVTVPVIVTVPNAASGHTRPAAGWPIVIFQHGITRNRVDGLAISGTLALNGYAMVAIDLPLHGLTPAGAFTSPLYVENTPFGPVASERTFDVDYIDNTTGAAGPDGVVDPSGTHFINLSSLLTSRDNLRQAIADLFVLTASIPGMDIDGNGAGDFDASHVRFVGQSLGAIVGTPFLALEPTVNVGVLSAPGGGIARLLDGSATFGPRIRAGLAAAAGLQPGTPDYDRYFGATQQIIDSADPINYGFAALQNSILLHEVVGGGTEDGTQFPSDRVVPNTVPGAPLSGTEPLIAALGLDSLFASTENANGVRGAVRFTVGAHGSLLDPSLDPLASLAATQEMQVEMASMLNSAGTEVVIQNPAVIRTQ